MMGHDEEVTLKLKLSNITGMKRCPSKSCITILGIDTCNDTGHSIDLSCACVTTTSGGSALSTVYMNKIFYFSNCMKI